MKFVKYSVLALFVGFTCSINPTFADTLDTEKADSREYLLNYGHSPDVVRMVELQKTRSIGVCQAEKNNRVMKFLKNLYYERNLTMPLQDFGQSSIETPEAPLIRKKLFKRK